MESQSMSNSEDLFNPHGCSDVHFYHSLARERRCASVCIAPSAPTWLLCGEAPVSHHLSICATNYPRELSSKSDVGQKTM